MREELHIPFFPFFHYIITISIIYIYICSVIILNYSYLASIHCTHRFYSRIPRKRNAIAEYVSQYSWTTPCISIILEFCCWRDGRYDWFCDQGPVVIGDTCMLHSICLKHSSSTKISALTPKVWFPAGLVDGFFETDKKSRGFSEDYPSRVRLIEGYIKIKNDQNSQTLMWLFRSIFSCPTAATLRGSSWKVEQPFFSGQLAEKEGQTACCCRLFWLKGQRTICGFGSERCDMAAVWRFGAL